MMKKVLLTELDDDNYKKDEVSLEEEDELEFDIDLENEDDLFMVRSRRSKNKPLERVINFNDIENEKDYETDLEGLN